MKFKSYIVFIVFLGLSVGVHGQTTFNATSTYTTGPAETCVRVQVWGAGGGGAGNAQNTDGGGAGGGGGYSESYITVLPSTVYTVTVGVGGAGGVGSNDGGNGGVSWFSTIATIRANGGTGGTAPSNNGMNGGPGGAGGVIGIGSITFTGGNGGNGADAGAGRGGGGGSSAGTAANGANGGNGTGGGAGAPGAGATAPAGGGNGGNGGNTSANGANGTAPGGGGGGSGELANGGNGANGRVIVTPSALACPTGTSIAPAATQSICSGLPTNLLTATSSSGVGCPAAVQYQWYSSLVNSNTIGTGTAIAGATSSTYLPPNLIVGTLYYFCVAYAPSCGQLSTTQVLASNVVQVTILTGPSTPNAGANQSLCLGASTTMAANVPAVGTGAWTIVSGPNVLLSQLASTTSATSAFTPAGGLGSYVLRWTVSNACGSLFDDVVINVSCGGACPPCSYLHPAGIGIAGEKVGACEVADCGPSVYTDDGGAGGNYSNNIGSGLGQNAVYRVFCPSIAGNCSRVTFNSFNTFNNLDVLFVRNGPTEYSPNFTGFPNSPCGYFGNPSWDNGLWGNLNGVTPFSFTSTHPSGCLTFAFVTSAVNTAAGWSATISCTPCAGGPTGIANSDCINATPVCSNIAIPSNSTGPGIVAEGCNGTACPAGGENHSNWYRFTPSVGGTLNITITPQTITDDYDFAVFGPNVSCGALGAPIRCSDSGATGVTGAIGTPPGDPSTTTEDVTGDKFVNLLNVNAGDTYYLMIDEWTPTGLGYTVSFSGTAVLDCVVLPIELVDFTATYNPEFHGADLYWKTNSEYNNDYFTLERSTDAIHYDAVAKVAGAGTTNHPTEYFAFDPEVGVGVTYYRLKQTDFDGNFKYSEIKSINVLEDENDQLTLFPNPTTAKTEVVFNTYQAGAGILTVTDARGIVLMNAQVDCISGANRFEIDLSDVKQGMYFVTVTTSAKSYTGKLFRN